MVFYFIYLLSFLQFHMKTNQGIKNFSREQAGEMAKDDPDFAIRDLFNAIENKNYPSWTM